MDAVVIGSFATVAVSVVIVGFLAYKVISLINKTNSDDAKR